MNLEQLNKTDHIIYSVLAGSHLYGLNIPTSDEDIRGIYNLPLPQYVLPHHPKQISDETNDTTYYELVRFLDLAKTANPNILELLFAPDHKILHKHPSMDIILNRKEEFLTKAAKNSLAGYAVAQIKKARGLKKLIVNPVTERKTVLDFCYIHTGNEGSMPVREWLEREGLDQANVGLAVVNNFTNTYSMYNKETVVQMCENDREYYDKEGVTDAVKNWFPKGMVKEDLSSNELRLTSIPKPIAETLEPWLISYNKDGYTVHCKDYAKYTEWVAKRNPARYATNMKHNKGYDSKNMMHCMRLLKMGTELAETGVLNVYRTDRDYLMKIRTGELPYDELLENAESLIEGLDKKFDESGLPNSMSQDTIDEIIWDMKL